ncbi:MAG: PEGA domain-containing protein [Polyangiaceae bacterium]|nr:PEGA domain-containing protein [Polyangiaceae bacterium]
MLRIGTTSLRGGWIFCALLAAALGGCGGAQKEPVEPAPAPAAPAGDSAPEPEGEVDTSGLLDVIAGQPTEILIDGKPVGTTPISGHKVAPGSHEVTFVDAARGNRTMMVTVEAGEAKTVQSDAPPPVIEGAKDDKDKK